MGAHTHSHTHAESGGPKEVEQMTERVSNRHRESEFKESGQLCPLLSFL